VKKALRSAKGAATLKLPVTPTAATKNRLRAKGKAKLALKLRFSPTGGKPAVQTKKVTLLLRR
jgi:hypothetical protein